MQKVATESKIRTFTDLFAWQEGHKLVLGVYEATKRFPAEERFGLANQLRRAAVSVTSNIAEGFGRKTDKDKIQFYVIARGSLAEVQNQLIVGHDVGYLAPEIFQDLTDRAITAHKLIVGLIKSIESSS